MFNIGIFYRIKLMYSGVKSLVDKMDMTCEASRFSLSPPTRVEVALPRPGFLISYVGQIVLHGHVRGSSEWCRLW